MYRLIYKSDNVGKMNWAIATSILRSSTRRNQAAGLTGVLLLGKKHFLQVLEGEFNAVNATFQRISHDPRHRNIRIVSFEVVEARLFPNWEMHGVGVFEFDKALNESLLKHHGDEEGEIRFPEVGWQALALIQDMERIERQLGPAKDNS